MARPIWKGSINFGLVSVPAPVPLRPFTFFIAYSSAYETDLGHRWFRQCVLEAGRSS